jgi:hypothetical protein
VASADLLEPDLQTIPKSKIVVFTGVSGPGFRLVG